MSLRLHRLERERILEQAVGVAHLQSVGRGAIHPAGKPDGARRALFLPRLDESFGFHAGKKDVHRAALHRATRPLDQLEAESLAIFQQIEEEGLSSGYRRKPCFAHVRAILHSVSIVSSPVSKPTLLTGYSAVSPGFNSRTSTPCKATSALKFEGVPVSSG